MRHKENRADWEAWSLATSSSIADHFKNGERHVSADGARGTGIQSHSRYDSA
jgi:hypothetical protein